MSRVWRHLSSDDDVLELIETLGGKSALAPCYVRAIYFRQPQGEWKFVTGKCEVGGNVQDECLEAYPQHAFVSKVLAQMSVQELLKRLGHDGVEVASGFPPIRRIVPTTSWKEELIPGHVRAPGRPARRFVVTLDNNANIADEQLVDFKLPYAASATRRATEFLEMLAPHESAEGRRGEFVIEVTDQRGAIRRDGDRLSITNRTVDLRLLGTIDGRNVDIRNDEVVEVGNKSIRDIELWLVAKDNSIVDCLSTSQWPFRFDAKPDDSADEAGLLEMVRKGESETCEFKPYIDLGNMKATEMEKTVCAFSNQRGGVLVLGVTKEGDIVGLAKDVAKRGADPANGIADYEKKVRDRLRESLKDNQCFTVKVVSLAGASVIVVEVGSAREINYLLLSEHMHTAYIRHGATSMKMSPPEIYARIENTRAMVNRFS